MKRENLITIVQIMVVPTLYAVALRLFFGGNTWGNLFSVMSMSFLFCVPTIMGLLTVYLSDIENVRHFSYRFFVPWIPVVILLIITIAFTIEGWACWLMILPLFLIAASVGGLIGGQLKMRKHDSKLYISFLALLPLLVAPLEVVAGSISGTYEAYTFIDIKAPAEKIWGNVTRVRGISAAQDKGWLTRVLGFPRPVKAELNYNGVGAYRKAIFTNGLVFHETVSEYADKQKMVFSIKAYPYEIPSTTMDEHVVIGGQYFDVLNGTYELERLNSTTNRLHLYSHFKLKTTFNFYASWWARWIMQDIQNNILQVEKYRSENE
ncbi:hypothetical protein J2I47_04355 [Fibrella sp. HMF5335]|uniref:Polyketide cyclase / dehydrase and lipid transport n=1 Tax=Fibrella rubiginis TaxID=2817060 RepID=A0A939GDI1_9BACT|nr:hypothetical protein [Fibrella rubiginis]MBO0935773.1 hypothetical protein [Fibrella rubiginis]